VNPNVSSRARSSFAVRLAVVMMVAFAIRLAYALIVTRHFEYGIDAIWYQLQAGYVSNGVGYIDPTSFFDGMPQFTANFPPLHPLLLALVAEAYDTELAFQLAGCVVGTVTVGLVALLGRRVAGEHAGLLAAVLAAASPFLVAADLSLMAEGLYVALVVACVLAAYRALDRPTPGRWILLGVLLGAAALTRSEGAFLAAILVLPLVVELRARWSVRAGLAATALICCLAVMMPWFVRNERAMGEPVLLSTNSATLVAGANCDETYSGKALGSWEFECARSDRFNELGELAYAETARSEAWTYAREHWTRLPLVGSARVLRAYGLWNPVDQARVEEIESRWFPWQIAGWVVSVLLLPFAVAGFVLLARRPGLALWPLLAPIVTVTVTILAGWGNQRFRLPAEPVLLIAAAVALEALWNRVHVPSSRAASSSGRATDF
jgi:4-amino-4-deoxy-L-arabinose transferase-like glycosyltransferase